MVNNDITTLVLVCQVYLTSLVQFFAIPLYNMASGPKALRWQPRSLMNCRLERLDAASACAR
jgi:hypothetical protein